MNQIIYYVYILPINNLDIYFTNPTENKHYKRYLISRQKHSLLKSEHLYQWTTAGFLTILSFALSEQMETITIIQYKLSSMRVYVYAREKRNIQLGKYK